MLHFSLDLLRNKRLKSCKKKHNWVLMCKFEALIRRVGTEEDNWFICHRFLSVVDILTVMVAVLWTIDFSKY